jgi:hypothetical protein
VCVGGWWGDGDRGSGQKLTKMSFSPMNICYIRQTCGSTASLIYNALLMFMIYSTSHHQIFRMRIGKSAAMQDQSHR